MRRRPAQRANRQWQPGLQKGAHDRVGALQFQEPGENQAQSSLHLLIWIENDTAARPVGKTHGQRYAEFSARRLLAFPLMQADLDLVQLGFAHDPGQAKQQAIMINAGCGFRRSRPPIPIGSRPPIPI